MKWIYYFCLFFLELGVEPLKSHSKGKWKKAPIHWRQEGWGEIRAETRSEARTLETDVGVAKELETRTRENYRWRAGWPKDGFAASNSKETKNPCNIGTVLSLTELTLYTQFSDLRWICVLLMSRVQVSEIGNRCELLFFLMNKHKISYILVLTPILIAKLLPGDWETVLGLPVPVTFFSVTNLSW